MVKGCSAWVGYQKQSNSTQEKTKTQEAWISPDDRMCGRRVKTWTCVQIPSSGVWLDPGARPAAGLQPAAAPSAVGHHLTRTDNISGQPTHAQRSPRLAGWPSEPP